ncbi:MAG: glutamyl-tRNA reductase, partial [Clostridia bacterium]|nr:glutamyl-tRNA reductase [Clostridia bacterium]
MNCISISHKKADVSVRKSLSLSKEECRQLIRYINKADISRECVVLSTCNRTEIYYTDDRNDDIIDALARHTGLTPSFLLKYVMVYCGDKAVKHLFRVACGIDSMIVGEDEILGQTKTAYSIAKEENAVGYETNVVFQAAVACAKRIKTETLMSKTSVSAATLAANEAAKISDHVSVLVIGASGKIGMSTLKNLLSFKNVTVKATLRRNMAKKKELEELGVSIVDYNERYNYIADSDCIISATSSPHYTVTACDLQKNLKDSRQRLFIDLAVPPDIDGSAASLNGVKLMNIDYFETLAKENNYL